MRRDANNYDLLRLLLALAVIFGHSGALNPGHAYRDPIAWLIGFDYSAGVAVKVFFFLSGLFVTDSIISHRSSVHFVVMRVCRIFPGLYVCLLLCLGVVGPLFTELSLAEYFQAPPTLSYLTANLALTDLQWRLPGVFVDSEYGLNGSLWTLPIEVRLYGCILLLHWLGVLAGRCSASLAIALAGYFLLRHPEMPYGGRDVQALGLCFLVGMASAIHKRDVPIHGALVTTLWLGVAGTWHSGWQQPVFYLAVFQSLIYAFRLPAIRHLRLRGDYSYGVYIYGFVVQQIFANLFSSAHPLANAAICMPVSTAIAALSWHLVEKPALASAHRFLAAPHALTSLPLDARNVRRVAGLLMWPTLALLAPQGLRLLPGFAEASVVSPDLRVAEYGPVLVTHGQAFNPQPDGSSAIWARLSRRVPSDTELQIGTTRLTSRVAGDLITARVPDALFAQPGQLVLRVIEHVRGHAFASVPVPWTVR